MLAAERATHREPIVSSVNALRALARVLLVPREPPRAIVEAVCAPRRVARAGPTPPRTASSASSPARTTLATASSLPSPFANSHPPARLAVARPSPPPARTRAPPPRARARARETSSAIPRRSSRAHPSAVDSTPSRAARAVRRVARRSVVGSLATRARDRAPPSRVGQCPRVGSPSSTASLTAAAMAASSPSSRGSGALDADAYERRARAKSCRNRARVRAVRRRVARARRALGVRRVPLEGAVSSRSRRRRRVALRDVGQRRADGDGG